MVWQKGLFEIIVHFFKKKRKNVQLFIISKNFSRSRELSLIEQADWLMDSQARFFVHAIDWNVMEIPPDIGYNEFI